MQECKGNPKAANTKYYANSQYTQNFMVVLYEVIPFRTSSSITVSVLFAPVRVCQLKSMRRLCYRRAQKFRVTASFRRYLYSD